MGCDNTIATVALVIACICLAWLVLRWVTKRWFTGSWLDRIVGGAEIDVDIEKELDKKTPIEFIQEIFVSGRGLNDAMYEKYIANNANRMRVCVALKKAVDPASGQPYLERDDFDDDYLGHELSRALRDLGKAMQEDGKISEWTYGYIRRYLNKVDGMIALADRHKPDPKPVNPDEDPDSYGFM